MFKSLFNPEYTINIKYKNSQNFQLLEFLKSHSSGSHRYIYIYIYMLYFDLRPGQKCHSKMMHWKEGTLSNSSYERKSRGQKLADEIGRGKKFPWYTHRLMHRKRVTCELHDSYFCLMTIQHAIPKIE